MNTVALLNSDSSLVFYYVKGTVWLVGTLLLIVYMNLHWVDRWGQRLRFLTFLYYGMLGTWRSVAEVHDGLPVNPLSVGGFIGAMLLVLTMVVSLREDKGQPKATDRTHFDNDDEEKR